MPASNSAADSGLVRDAFSRVKELLNGKANLNHAARHAVGGADPITPASIGVLPIVATSDVPGHVDNILESGTHRILATDATVENGYPPLMQGSSVLYLRVDRYISTNDSYIVQHLYDQSGRAVWFRTRYGTWVSWKRLVTDDDPRLRDTGWRSIELLNGWGNNGALPHTSPAIRRISNTVMIRMRNLDTRGSTNAIFAMLPSGFIPPSADGGIAVFGGSTVRPVYVSTDGSARVGNPETVNGVAAATSISYLTEQPWPTTLPGTPV